MKIALASPRLPNSINEALLCVEKLMEDAVNQHAEIICFPESYIPGYPGLDVEVTTPSPEELVSALHEVCKLAAKNSIAIIIPMDWYQTGELLNVAYVISNKGEILGYQTKNQLDPSEDTIWIPGTERSIFEVNGVKLGITICHEGFRYPESVRWAAQRDAKIVFHPQCTGSNIKVKKLTEWGAKENPYYEKAMMMRALENTVYFASCNYAFDFPDSASSIIAPDGSCVAHANYGEVGVIVADVDIELATGLLAKRFKNKLFV
ncbi:MAG: carbon-nitrogen hydrolase family protein [Daejeonella sp.]|nr:carbon-nitrogen hydrolase family protein [Daejeonella sp.]